jgi:glucosamine--fructose-6-phosphate aminotransferase (isomerizing)
MFRKIALGGLAISSWLLGDSKDAECCGIIGMVSKQPVTEEEVKEAPTEKITLEKFLCDGVELLKNRGYDSAGIFRFGNGMEGKLIKYADEGDNTLSCIDRVIQEVLKESGVGTGGIAHTRWATCGARVSQNAHPHFDQTGRFYAVHNGIITNHGDIKAHHLKGVKLTSETDTEIMVQFIAKEVLGGSSMHNALKAFGRIAGDKSQWGLVIVDREQPDKIYTYTNGSPLLIGFSKTEDQIYVVSERIAFQTFADYYLPTNDDEIFELSANDIPQLKEKYKLRLIKMEAPPPVLKEPPAPFKTFFSYEVRQQSNIPFEPEFDRIKDTLKFGDYLTMVACGSSFYAGQVSEPLFKALKCFKKFHVVDPAELDKHDITENETVVVISQSGETKDLIRIVDELKPMKNISTIGIINVEGSTLARKVDFPIYIKVGREICVAATKSFFHQVLNLIQFATEVAEQKNNAPL